MRGGADNGVGVGFEIAHLVEKWYDSPETNFGIKLAAHLEASQYNDNLVFHSSRSQTGTAPYLSLTYTEFVPVERIEITGRPADDKLEVGYFMPVHSLKALVYPENATNKEVIWESSDENVGYMESYGLESYFNPVSLGTTTITAKSADNNEIIDSFDLEVYNIPITEIQIMALPDNNTLIAGKKHELSLLPLPYEATDHSVFSSNWAIWTSSDETVASVNNGTITTYKQGTTVVTATYGELTDSFTLTVTEVPLTSVALENETSAIEIGDIYYLNTVVSPQNASDKRATATSSAPEVATIECITSPTNYFEAPTFKITALSEGEVTFTIQFLDDPTKVLTTSMYVIYIDHSINIIKPENDTINAYEVWQLTDTEDVTITAPSEIGLLGDGKIVAYEPGNYTIILSNGIESVMYEIRVGAEMTITGLPENNTIKIGERYEDLQIEFDFPQFGDIEWSSSDENIAEIYYDYVRARVVLIGKGEGVVSIEARMLGTSFNAVQQIEVIPQPVEKVKLFTPNLVNGNTIYLGQRYTINSKVYPLDSPCATFDRVNYTDTNNLLIFTDTELRLITYVTAKTENIQKEAKTQIYAEAGGVYSEPKTVTVKAPKATIKNRPTNDTIYKNATHTLSYESDPETGVNIRWYSSNSSIAKIDEQTGKIEAKSVGSVTISIKVKYGDYSEITDSFTLYVSNANLFISGDGGDDKEILTVGETKQLTAEVVAGENASQEVEWISDTPSVATVDSNGLVTAHAPGEVIISAKSKKYEYAIDTAYFEVVIIPTKIEINAESNEVFSGRTLQLETTLEPAKATSDLKWSSSDDTVAIVKDGLVTAIDYGKVTITAKSIYDDSVIGTFDLQVWSSKTSYIFYVDDEKSIIRKDFAEKDQKVIADKYYGGETDYVELISVGSKRDFLENWNNMGNNNEIGYIVISCHSYPEYLITIDDNEKLETITLTEIENLSHKNPEGLIMLGCFSGHLDYEDNVAESFAKIVNGSPVIAADGNVNITTNGFVTLNTSCYDDDFYNLSVEVNPHAPRNEGEGWIMYLETSYINEFDKIIKEIQRIPYDPPTQKDTHTMTISEMLSLIDDINM